MESNLPKAKEAQNQKSLAPIDELRGSLKKMEGQLKAVLPPHVSPEKFIRVTLTAVQNNPDLLVKAERRSLFNACMRAAQDGLLPDGRESALAVYGNVAQYLPMVVGILKKIRNSGELASIATQVIFHNDKFRYWVDDSGEHLEHHPKLFGNRGAAIGAYAIAKTKDGGVYVEVMTAEDIQRIKQMSRAKNGPWTGAFELEMWRKTALRRLSKRLPMSTDIEREDEGQSPTAPSVPPEAMGELVDAEVSTESKAEEPAQPEKGSFDDPQADPMLVK